MDQYPKKNLLKLKILLQTTLFILYAVWVTLIVSRFDIDTSIRITREGADLLQRMLLICTIVGTALTSLYLMALNKDQVKEQKNAKSLLAMYIIVIITTLYSTDIAIYIKNCI